MQKQRERKRVHDRERKEAKKYRMKVEKEGGTWKGRRKQ
jgi:hypothetical protein